MGLRGEWRCGAMGNRNSVLGMQSRGLRHTAIPIRFMRIAPF
jgi:hypothetical protein